MNIEHKKLLRRTLAAIAACGPIAAVAFADDKDTAPPTPVPSNAAPETGAAKVPAPTSEAPKKNETADTPPVQAPSLPNPANAESDSKPQPNANDDRSDESQPGDKNREDRANPPAERATSNDNRPNSPSGNARDSRNPANPQDRSGYFGRDAASKNSAAARQQSNRTFSNNPADRTMSRGNAGQRGSLNYSNVNIGLAFGAAAGGPLVISSVAPNSYFSTVGFQPGDRIISANGRSFNNQANFYAWLGTVAVGQRIPIMILRNGQQQTVYWTPTQEFMAAYSQPAPSGNAVQFLGIQLDEQVTDAAVVRAVEPNSPAHQAGVQIDDAIVAVNGRQVNNPNEFASATANLQEGSQIDLAVSRIEHLQIAPNGPRQQTTLRPLSETPSAPAIAPVPVQSVPAQRIAPSNPPPRRGLFRGR